MRHGLAVAGLMILAGVCSGGQVKSLRVTILSTMLAESVGIGEWGFAALVEVDGRRILFDTGARPDTVLKNAAEMGVDLSIEDVVLSHNHRDHTGGLMTLRVAMAKRNPKSLSRAHTGEGMFWPRMAPGRPEGGFMVELKQEYEKSGGVFVNYGTAKELFPGVWLTGPVPRKHAERNWSGSGQVRKPDGAAAEDNLPEDMSMVFDTARGLVVLSGCGHAGIINTIEHARARIARAPVHAAIGGFHLFGATDEQLAWTGGKLKESGLENFVGAHCTGIETVYRIREVVGLGRRHSVVGSVGAKFELGKGIEAGALAR